MKRQFKVKYLGHSAFLVDTDKYYLIFDYSGTTNEGGYGVTQVDIDFENYQDKKIIMFGSHDHFDHYNRDIHEKAQKYNNITTVLGDINCDFERTISMKPREIKRLDDITIYTAGSTDMGVCFLVDLGNLVIFHGGDNADWGDGDPDNDLYYEELEYLSNIGLNIDIAFIPICNFMGERPIKMIDGSLFAIEVLKPEYVFPMHAASREYIYEDFAKDVIKSTTQIICMKKIGEEF